MLGFTFKRSLAAVVAGALLFNEAAAGAAESAFWAERRRRVPVPGSAASVWTAALPAETLPSVERVIRSSVLAAPAVRALPPAFARSHAGLLEALSGAAGSVRSVALPAGTVRGVVVHVQDVHHDEEAQRNIGRVLRAMNDASQAGLVALEGAFAPIDLARARAFPRKDVLDRAADFLLSTHGISGPVHAALTSEKPFPALLGVDDPSRYRANVDAYRRSAPRIDGVKRGLAGRRAALDRRKAAVFNAALLAFDAQMRAYESGALPLGGYVKALASAAGRAPAGVSSFLRALEMEKSLDLKEVSAERARLVEELVRRLSRERVAELTGWSAAFRAGQVRAADFYGFLRDVCAGAGMDLARFPAMDAYVRYVLAADRLDAGGLMGEIADLEKSAYDRLAVSSEEKDLARASRALALAWKLADFSLTPGEWDEYEEERGGHGIDLASFESFYEEAHARDQAMADNLLQAMAARGTSTAVLVTGGYHSPGVDERLRRAGMAVVSFTPRIDKIDTPQGAAYLSVFSQEKTPLEKLFQGQKLFLATPPAEGLPLLGALAGADEAAGSCRAAGVPASGVRAWSRAHRAELARTVEDALREARGPEGDFHVEADLASAAGEGLCLTVKFGHPGSRRAVRYTVDFDKAGGYAALRSVVEFTAEGRLIAFCAPYAPHASRLLADRLPRYAALFRNGFPERISDWPVFGDLPLARAVDRARAFQFFSRLAPLTPAQASALAIRLELEGERQSAAPEEREEEEKKLPPKEDGEIPVPWKLPPFKIDVPFVPPKPSKTPPPPQPALEMPAMAPSGRNPDVPAGEAAVAPLFAAGDDSGPGAAGRPALVPAPAGTSMVVRTEERSGEEGTKALFRQMLEQGGIPGRYAFLHLMGGWDPWSEELLEERKGKESLQVQGEIDLKLLWIRALREPEPGSGEDDGRSPDESRTPPSRETMRAIYEKKAWEVLENTQEAAGRAAEIEGLLRDKRTRDFFKEAYRLAVSMTSDAEDDNDFNSLFHHLVRGMEDFLEVARLMAMAEDLRIDPFANRRREGFRGLIKNWIANMENSQWHRWPYLESTFVQAGHLKRGLVNHLWQGEVVSVRTGDGSSYEEASLEFARRFADLQSRMGKETEGGPEYQRLNEDLRALKDAWESVKDTLPRQKDDPYTVLGIPRDADYAQGLAAYRRRMAEQDESHFTGRGRNKAERERARIQAAWFRVKGRLPVGPSGAATTPRTFEKGKDAFLKAFEDRAPEMRSLGMRGFARATLTGTLVDAGVRRSDAEVFVSGLAFHDPDDIETGREDGTSLLRAWISVVYAPAAERRMFLDQAVDEIFRRHRFDGEDTPSRVYAGIKRGIYRVKQAIGWGRAFDRLSPGLAVAAFHAWLLFSAPLGLLGLPALHRMERAALRSLRRKHPKLPFYALFQDAFHLAHNARAWTEGRSREVLTAGGARLGSNGGGALPGLDPGQVHFVHIVLLLRWLRAPPGRFPALSPEDAGRALAGYTFLFGFHGFFALIGPTSWISLAALVAVVGWQGVFERASHGPAFGPTGSWLTKGWIPPLASGNRSKAPPASVRSLGGLALLGQGVLPGNEAPRASSNGDFQAHVHAFLQPLTPVLVLAGAAALAGLLVLAIRRRRQILALRRDPLATDRGMTRKEFQARADRLNEELAGGEPVMNAAAAAVWAVTGFENIPGRLRRMDQNPEEDFKGRVGALLAASNGHHLLACGDEPGFSHEVDYLQMLYGFRWMMEWRDAMIERKAYPARERRLIGNALLLMLAADRDFFDPDVKDDHLPRGLTWSDDNKALLAWYRAYVRAHRAELEADTRDLSPALSPASPFRIMPFAFLSLAASLYGGLLDGRPSIDEVYAGVPSAEWTWWRLPPHWLVPSVSEEKALRLYEKVRRVLTGAGTPSGGGPSTTGGSGPAEQARRIDADIEAVPQGGVEGLLDPTRDLLSGRAPETEAPALAAAWSPLLGRPAEAGLAAERLEARLAGDISPLETPVDVSMLVSPALLDRPGAKAAFGWWRRALRLLHGGRPVRVLVESPDDRVPAALAAALDPGDQVVLLLPGGLFKGNVFNMDAVESHLPSRERLPGAVVYLPDGAVGDRDPRLLPKEAFVFKSVLERALRLFREISTLIALQA